MGHKLDEEITLMNFRFNGTVLNKYARVTENGVILSDFRSTPDDSMLDFITLTDEEFDMIVQARKEIRNGSK